ncbi:MAG: hypothetical protein ACJ8CB_34195 [Ktedonobacteraceae bacterium]
MAVHDCAGQWQQGDIAQARSHLRPLARAETSLQVQQGKQLHLKKQPVVVEVAACSLCLTYSTAVRRKEEDKQVSKPPWLLITDWSVEDEQLAVRIFAMYRQRWAVENMRK